MADTKEMSAEAAKALVDAILKQSELLGSWALAVFGAGVFLVVWYVQRRLDQPNQPTIRGWVFIVFSILFQGVSILLMYFAYGIIVNLIPELQFTKLDTADKFYDLLTKNTSFNNAQWLLVLQFLCFFVGIVCLGIFGLSNARLIRSTHRR
jgi:hypothetical protein